MKREVRTNFRKANVEYFVDTDDDSDNKEMSTKITLSSDLTEYSDNVLQCFSNSIGSYLSLGLFYDNPRDIEAYDTKSIYSIVIRIIYDDLDESDIFLDKCKATPYFGRNRIVFSVDVYFNNSENRIKEYLETITNIQKTLYKVKEVIIVIDDGKE